MIKISQNIVNEEIMTNKTDLGPQIRVGFLQNQKSITVNAAGDIVLRSGTTMEVPGPATLTFTISDGKPASGSYKLRLSNHKTTGEAEKELSNLPDNYPGGSILKVGRPVIHNEKELYDNTSYWLCNRIICRQGQSGIGKSKTGI